jgi:hypothetical protein
MFKFRELTKNQVNKIKNIEAQVREKEQLMIATKNEIDSLNNKAEKIRFPKIDQVTAFGELIMLPHNLITINVCPRSVGNSGMMKISINKNIYIKDTKDTFIGGQFGEEIRYSIRNYKTVKEYCHEIDKLLTHYYKAPKIIHSYDIHDLTDFYACALVSHIFMDTVILSFSCSDEVTQKIIDLFDVTKEDTWEESIAQAVKILKKEAELRINPFESHQWKLQDKGVIKAFDEQRGKYLKQKVGETE